MGYVSHGGVGSIEFSFEELERTAAMLRNSTQDLTEGASKLVHFPEPSAALLAIGPVHLQIKLLSIIGELKSLAARSAVRAAESGALMLKVTLSRRSYEQAEAAATRSINEARGKWLPVLLLWDLATNHRRPRGVTMEAIINEFPRYLDAGIPQPFGFGSMLKDTSHGGYFDKTVAQRLYPVLSKNLDSLGLVEMGKVQLAAANSPSTLKTGTGVETLLELQEIAELEPPGSILVSTVKGNQTPVHIVTIPGTQDSPLNPKANIREITGELPDGSVAQNPWEFTGIAEGMGFGSQHVSGAVSEALSDAGAHPGDKIILSGYSQGGIHASNLAGDTRLTDTYQVSYVFTAGSPVALAAIPKTTKALHLEDRNDMVPGTDGSENPAGRNRVTVYFDRPTENVELTDGGFGPAHKLDNYREHGKELAGSTDPSIAESTAQLTSLLTGSGALSVKSYQLRRVVTDKSKPRPKPKVKGWPMKDPHPAMTRVTSGWG